MTKQDSAPKSAKARSGHNHNRPPNKHELALIDLLEAGKTGVSKLTTWFSYGETSLPTTISELGAIGFSISRELRGHIHRNGGKTKFTWYWLPHCDEAQKAVFKVNELRRKRNAKPIDEQTSMLLVAQFSTPEKAEEPHE